MFFCLADFFPSAFSKRIFHIFPSAFSKGIFSHFFAFFHMFHMFCEKYEKSVEKMRFEHVLRKKCEKCEKHLKIQLGRWSSDFVSLLQLLRCQPNFCRLKIEEEQFKSISMTTRSKNINSNAEGEENKASKLLKNTFSHFFTF